jgi:DNA-directed RNA polymerase specialized sigma24 family protein
MSQEIDLGAFTVAGIAHRCAQETQRFFERLGYDARYCFELFRRAVVDRSQQAWESIYDQYRSLVGGWVQRHAAFPDAGEDVHYFVNRAFERMWLAVDPDKFQRFPDLKSILRYLQMCVHSALTDQVRKAAAPLADVEVERQPTGGAPANRTVEDHALHRVHRREFWREVEGRLKDEKERCVVYGAYVLALKPRQIYEHFPDTFLDVREIYRVKENVLARLRRDTELHKSLTGNA